MPPHALAPAEDLATFPLQLTELLVEHADALHADVRRVVAQALILMRNRGGLEALPLLKVFFRLFRVKDKLVREGEEEEWRWRQSLPSR